eukprot:scaffold24543_cov195-Amphora_coffeaeformis.AAC.4
MIDHVTLRWSMVLISLAVVAWSPFHTPENGETVRFVHAGRSFGEVGRITDYQQTDDLGPPPRKRFITLIIKTPWRSNLI